MRIDSTDGVVRVADPDHRWKPTTALVWNKRRTHSYKNDPICPCGGLFSRWNDVVPADIGITIQFIGCSICSRRVMKFLLPTGTYFFQTESV